MGIRFKKSKSEAREATEKRDAPCSTSMKGEGEGTKLVQVDLKEHKVFLNTVDGETLSSLEHEARVRDLAYPTCSMKTMLLKQYKCKL